MEAAINMISSDVHRGVLVQDAVSPVDGFMDWCWFPNGVCGQYVVEEQGRIAVFRDC